MDPRLQAVPARRESEGIRLLSPQFSVGLQKPPLPVLLGVHGLGGGGCCGIATPPPFGLPKMLKNNGLF